MINQVLKVLALLLMIPAICTCIDPFFPRLDDYESLLVVEGLITDEKVPYEIILSRSIQNEDSDPERVTDARVYITDETGKKVDLENHGNGSYKTNPDEFTGATGKTYTLHINTSDGNEYESTPALMLPVAGIENIYYEKGEEFNSDQSESLEGIRIYVDAEYSSESSRYLRWEYEETWKFQLADYKRFNYINEFDIRPVEEVKEYCWRHIKSSVILNGAGIKDQTNKIIKAPVCFVASSASDRLSIQYSILVKQYSLSEEAYKFWNNLKQVNETGGTIYDKQPFPVVSNIHNLNNQDEKVLGYFQVSAVKQERKYITVSELDNLGIPKFRYDCNRFVVCPDDYPSSFGPPMTWDKLYNMFMDTHEFTFVEPIYNRPSNILQKLVFVQNECADCELTGSTEKPDWWVEMN